MAYWWVRVRDVKVFRSPSTMRLSLDSATDECVGADITTERYQSILLATERLS